MTACLPSHRSLGKIVAKCEVSQEIYMWWRNEQSVAFCCGGNGQIVAFELQSMSVRSHIRCREQGCHGSQGIDRPNDSVQPHLRAHPQALPISPQAIAISTAWATLKLCLCPVLPLAWSLRWALWTHAVTWSLALSLDSSAVPDWSLWTCFVLLLSMMLLIDPITSCSSDPCVQPLRDGDRGCGHACARPISAPSLCVPQGQPDFSVPNKVVLLVTTVWPKICLCQC